MLAGLGLVNRSRPAADAQQRAGVVSFVLATLYAIFLSWAERQFAIIPNVTILEVVGGTVIIFVGALLALGVYRRSVNSNVAEFIGTPQGARALACIRATDVIRAIDLAIGLARAIDLARIIDLARAITRIVARFTYADPAIQHPGLGHVPQQDWQLTEEQLKVLGAYVSSTELLLKCLDLAVIENRQAVLDHMLISSKD